MRPLPPFAHHDPASLLELLELMARHQPSARILAGGTELLPKLRAGRFAPEHVIGIRRVPELDRLEVDDRGALTIGAACRLSDVAAHPAVGSRFRSLAQACGQMATTQIRNMATVAGNLVNGSPCADTAGPLLVHDARVVIGSHAPDQGGIRQRELALQDLFVGPGAVAMEAHEVLIAIEVPPCPSGAASAYRRHSARSRVDVAAASASALVVMKEDGTVSSARIAIGAVAPTPLRCPDGEALLTGKRPDEGVLSAAAEAAADISKPIDDVRASAAYRRAVLPVLVRRALTDAIETARDSRRSS